MTWRRRRCGLPTHRTVRVNTPSGICASFADAASRRLRRIQSTLRNRPGEITIGLLDPVGCVAVATDEDNSLAMLLRRPGETLAQLLARLDQAIDKALTEDIYTDEINSPSRRS